MAVSVGEIEATLKLRDELTPALQGAVGVAKNTVGTMADYMTRLDKSMKTAALGATTFEKELAKIAGVPVVEKANAMANAIGALGGASNLTQAQLRETAKALDAMAASSAAMGTKMPADLRLLREEVRRLTDDTKELAARYKETGAAMRSAGMALSVAVTAPIVAAGGAVLKFGEAFETAMTRVETLAGASADEMKRYRGEILALGPSVGAGPEALAQGLFTVRSAGLQGADAMDALTRAAKMSKIGMGDMFTVARTLVSTMTAFKQQNLSAADAADVLVATVQKGNMPIDSLATSLGRVTAIAASVGISFAEVGGAVAAFTRAGVKTAEAATGLRGLIMALEAPTDQTREALQRLGMTTDDLRRSISERGLAQTLVDLMAKTKGNVDLLRDIVPNVRAFAMALATAGAQGKDYLQIVDDIKNAHGIMETGFARTTETLGYQWDQLKAKIEATAVEMYDNLEPAAARTIKALSLAVDAARGASQTYGELPTPVQATGFALLGLAAAAGPVLLLAGGLLSSWGKVIEFFGKSSTTVWLLRGAMLVLVDAILAVGAAFAGWQLGKWIGDLTGWTDQIEVLAGRLQGLSTDEIVAAARAREAARAFAEFEKARGSLEKFAPTPGHAVTGMRPMAAHGAGVGGGGEEDRPSQASREEMARRVLMAGVNLKLSDSLKQIALDAFKAGRSVAQVMKAFEDEQLSVTGMDAALATLHDAWEKQEGPAKAARAAAEQFDKQAAALAQKLTPLPGQFALVSDQVERYGAEAYKMVETAQAQGRAVPQAVQEIADAWGRAELANAVGKDTVKWQKDLDKFIDDAEKSLSGFTAGIGKQIVAGFVQTRGAQRDAISGMLKDSLSRWDFERQQVAQWVMQQKAAFEGLPLQQASYFDAIEKIAQQKFKEIAEDERDALNEMRAQEQTWARGLAGLIGGIPTLMQQAFSGGGGMGGFGKALASGFGALAGEQLLTKPLTAMFNAAAPAISSALGMTMTTAIGTAIPLIGPAIGALVGPLLGKLFGGPSEKELKGREAGKQFQDQMRSALTEMQKAEAGTEGWRAVVVSMRDAYFALGTDAATAARMANAAMERLWAAERQGPEAVKRVTDELNATLEKAEARAEEIKTATEALPGAFAAVVEGATGAFEQWTGIAEAIDAARKARKEALDAKDEKALAQANKGLETAIAKQGAAALEARQELDDLGVQAVASFTAAVAAGMPLAEALDKFGPSLATIKKAYDDLGISIEDSAFKALAMQGAMAKENPKLTAGVAGLSSEIEALYKLGLLNADTFTSMERTGAQMYTRLQVEAAKAGGTTKDALLPMQGWLHRAAQAAAELGVPLDVATQLLIDQSKELGIWKEPGKSPMDRAADATEEMVKKLGELVEILTGQGGVVDGVNRITEAANRIPTNPFQNWEVPNPGGGAAIAFAAHGGLVKERGLVVQHLAAGGNVLPFRRGTDSVPAMLTPGEIVLTAAQQRNLAGQLATGTDGDGDYVPIVLNVDGLTLAKTLAKIVKRQGLV